MKAILTFFLVLFFGGISLAQDANSNQKVATLQQDIVLVESHLETENLKGLDTKGQTGFARLYRYKNSRVKSALFFTTKNNRPKLA